MSSHQWSLSTTYQVRIQVQIGRQKTYRQQSTQRGQGHTQGELRIENGTKEIGKASARTADNDEQANAHGLGKASRRSIHGQDCQVAKQR